MSLITRLCDRYPRLGFDDRPLAASCDDGWLSIVLAFLADVDKAMAAGGTFMLQQVEQKMGGLCIRYATTDVAYDARHAIDDAHRLASARSLHVCEICGRRGRLNNFGGLWKVVCSEHADGALGKDLPIEGPFYADGSYSPEADPLVAARPTVAEFDTAPIIDGWVIEGQGESGLRPWLYGWFFGHPDIGDGDHGHTSPMVQMDEMMPPRWVRSDSRLYRLGIHYPPAEREIRYWAQKSLRRPVAYGEPPGGSNGIEEMLIFLRSTGRLKSMKIDRMEQAYREEKEVARIAGENAPT